MDGSARKADVSGPVGGLSTLSSPLRRRDREKTRQEILEVAFAEFAERGFSGGNTDAIAQRANVTKRLIFYYFDSKAQLFTAVLEMAYERIRRSEESLRLDELSPRAAITKLVEFTF